MPLQPGSNVSKIIKTIFNFKNPKIKDDTKRQKKNH